MLVEKKKKQRTAHLNTLKHKQAASLGAMGPKKVTLPKFSWEKNDERSGVSAETRDKA